MKQLLIQLARFGDLVQSKRLILSLLGEGELYLCVDRSLESLAKILYPDVEVIPVSAHYTSGNNFSEHLRLFERLLSERFDRVYNINFSALSSSMTSIFEPSLVRGYARVGGQLLRDPWLELAFRLMQNRKIAPINLVDLWGHLADKAIEASLVNPVAVAKGGGLGVVLAGRSSKRSLSVEELIPCVHSMLVGQDYHKIYLLGTKSEEKAAREFFAKAPSVIRERLVDLCGKTNYQDLIDVVSTLDRILSIDTGTIHLAAHLGTPVTALFCSSAYAFETSVYGLGHELWQAQWTCCPCVENKPCLFTGGTKFLLCHQAFRQSRFYQALSGKNNVAVGNALYLRPDFDALGIIWKGEQDIYYTERLELRGLLAEFVHAQELSHHNSKIVESLFQDKDWILTRQI